MKKHGFKIFVSAFCAVLILLASFSVSAQNTVSFTSAVCGSVNLSADKTTAPDISLTDSFVVTLSVSSPYAISTIIVTDAENDINTLEDSDILYMNTISADASGNASFTFKLKPNTSYGTYAVYAGGEDVSSFAARYFTLPAPPTPTYLCGDVNLDGEVNISDAILILRYEKNLTLPDGCDILGGDVNLDSAANATDAKLIMRHIMGLPNTSDSKIGQTLNRP